MHFLFIVTDQNDCGSGDKNGREYNLWSRLISPGFCLKHCAIGVI